MPVTNLAIGGRNSLRQLLANDEAYATTLVVILADAYGTEFFSWAPETIYLEVIDDFGVKLPQENLDKIMAVITIMTTNEFQRNLPKFIHICNVLSDDEFDPTVFDPADSDEIAWALTEALLLDPVEEDEPFSDDIRRYIGFVLREEGIVNPPDILQIALQQRDVDPLSVVADDPEMYQAFYENQQSKGREITDMLKIQLKELFLQLESLPLSSGDTKNLLKRLQG